MPWPRNRLSPADLILLVRDQAEAGYSPDQTASYLNAWQQRPDGLPWTAERVAELLAEEERYDPFSDACDSGDNYEEPDWSDEP